MIKLAFVVFLYLVSFSSFANLIQTIKNIKPAIVGVGTYKPLSSPRAQLKGTGFFINNNLVVTNYHLVSNELDLHENERRVIFVGEGNRPKLIDFTVLDYDAAHDLALLTVNTSKKLNISPLKIETSPQPAGTEIAFTGFPIGAVLGLYPVTHRGIISALTPVVTPAANANQLSVSALKRLKKPFFTYQLDATAYPGNSGSPVYDQQTGKVIAVINKVFIKSSKESALTEPSGITYAIPIKFLEDLLNKQK